MAVSTSEESKVMDGHRLLEISYHEAGHVVACLVFSHGFQSVHVEEHKRAVKYGTWSEMGATNELTNQRLRERVIVYYAGLAAQRLHTPMARLSEAEIDYHEAEIYYRLIECPPPKTELEAEVVAFVSKYQDVIAIIANELSMKRVLTFDEVNNLVGTLIVKMM